MAYTLETYKGLQVPDSTPGVGGAALKTNFTTLADRIGECNTAATAAPTVGDDADDGYSVGSRWYDTTTDVEYVCLDATAGAAVWLPTTLVATAAQLGSGVVTGAKLDTSAAAGGLEVSGGAMRLASAAAGAGLELDSDALRLAAPAADSGLTGGAGSGLSIADGSITAARLGYAADAMVMVQRGDTDIESGTNLIAAYAAAKDLTPGGNALSTTNRAAVIAPPGTCDLGSQTLTLDKNYVDIIGIGVARFAPMNLDPAKLDNNGAPLTTLTTIPADCILAPASVVTSTATVVSLQAADVRVGQLHIRHAAGTSDTRGLELAAGSNGPTDSIFFDLAITNCSAMVEVSTGDLAGTWTQVHGQGTMGHDVTSTGSFIDCTGGNQSWSNSCSGHFERCFAGQFAFGGWGGVSSGTFIECIGGEDSFGSQATGTFRRCIGGERAFGGGLATGDFYDCIAGEQSFGGGQSGGYFERCTATTESFGSYISTGTYYDCRAEDDSFGAMSKSSGTYVRCEGTGNCWGGASTPAAVMRRCVNLNRSTPLAGWSGLMIGCEIHAASGDAVELQRHQYGASDQTCNTASTTSEAVITGDVESDFPADAFIVNSADDTWHRIVGASYDGSNTTVTVSPAASTTFDGLTVRAHAAPRIVDCTITAAGTGVTADYATPAIIAHTRSNTALGGNVANVLTSPGNVLGEEHLWSVYG